MSHVAIYLNFQGNTEKAFNYYRSVFGTAFSAPMMYIRDLPPNPDAPKFSEADLNCVMHVALPIIGGTELMGSKAGCWK
jgi:PhnB protein